MTWKEACEAFRPQTPVIVKIAGSSIRCVRIAEIAVRCDKEGNVTHVVGGMDKNENCIYHASPEAFTTEQSTGSGTERRSAP